MFRIVIAARSRPLQVALERLLSAEPGLTVVGRAGGAFPTLELVRRLEPDVVLVDLLLDPDSGLDLIAAVRHEAPHLLIVAALNGSNPASTQNALNAGATAWLDVTSGPDGGVPASLAHLLPQGTPQSSESRDDEAEPSATGRPSRHGSRPGRGVKRCVEKPARRLRRRGDCSYRRAGLAGSRSRGCEHGYA